MDAWGWQQLDPWLQIDNAEIIDTVHHEPDRPHDRTYFQVGTGFRSYSSPARLGAERATLAFAQLRARHRPRSAWGRTDGAPWFWRDAGKPPNPGVASQSCCNFAFGFGSRW